jgi:hypothetical protein
LLLLIRALGFTLLFDLGKKLATFTPPVIHKSVDVLLQTRHGVFHFRVETLGTH